MKKAAISIIKGGLGNQLFIYAAGFSFAKRTHRDFYLDTQLGFQNDSYERNYRLKHFPITASAMPDEWRIAPSLKSLRHKILRSWNKWLPNQMRSYIAQRWDKPPSQLTQNNPIKERVTLNGYWQDEKYFLDHANEIRQELSPPTPTDEINIKLGEKLSSLNSVMLHARRVRYPVLLPVSYYQQAIDEVCNRVENPHFIIFSDDMTWARENIDFGNHPTMWIEHNANDEIADLWLMSQCQHAIIANSSFSWWGAWLGGPASDKRIIFSPDHAEWSIRPARGWQCIPYKSDEV